MLVPLVAVFALLIGVLLHFGPMNIVANLWVFVFGDTEYVPGYSERAFRGLTTGDSEATVLVALGKPHRSWASEPYTLWLYASDPHPEFAEDGDFPDMRHSFTSIRFSADGRFVDAFGQISHGSSMSLSGGSASVSFGDGMNTLKLTDAEIAKLKMAGATPPQIEARFGKPRGVFESRVVKWLQYSWSPGSKDYRKRLIGLAHGGAVCRKVSGIYWD